MRDEDSNVPGESTLLFDIQEEIFYHQQEILHIRQAHCDETSQTMKVPLQKKWSHADPVIAHRSPQNLQLQARPIALLLVNSQYSTFNILRKADIVPANLVPLPKAGGDPSIPQPMDRWRSQPLSPSPGSI
jgi:hypothetical protein